MPGARQPRSSNRPVRRAIAPAITAFFAACALLGPASPAAASACPGADAQPTASNLRTLRTATLCLLNAERTPRGLPALGENAMLTAASQVYSELMVDRQFFAHVTPDGVDLKARLLGVGYIVDNSYWMVGENLAWGTGGMASPARIMQAWMESPGHRENILTPEFREVGLGVALGAPNSPTAPAAATYTTDFGVRDRAESGSTPAQAPARPAATRKRKPRSCAALKRAKARGKLSKASRKQLSRCARRAAARRAAARR
jgi:uncharacterized protein YkwD